jgi:CheY-like chemotaxis protein
MKPPGPSSPHPLGDWHRSRNLPPASRPAWRREFIMNAHHSKDQFLARLSHELRTPMAPILAISSLLEIDPTLPAKVREQLQVVRRNAQVEARLIDDLLDLTRDILEEHDEDALSVHFPAALPSGKDADEDVANVANTDRARPEASWEAELEPAERPLHILLVEDHADTAYAISQLLRRLGHRVTHADGPEEALAAASDPTAPSIDFVVSDLWLRSGSGLDLMPELARRYGLSGIAISGLGGEGAIARSRAAGFSRHLTKPVTFATLRDAIREFTEDERAS